MKIPLMSKTFIDSSVKRKLADFILQTDRYSMGYYCKEFEKKFSIFQNIQHSILFNSGSSANLAILQTLLNLGKIKKGDKIGFSALTWATNVMPIIELGLEPVPIDIDINYINVTSEKLKLRLSEVDIKVLFITNVLGFTGDLQEIKNVCDEENILLIEDNCESLGTEVDHINTGNFGIMSSFSFFVAHHLSTIEGGMVTSSDVEMADMLKMVRAHGWSRDLGLTKKLELKQKHQISSFYNKYTFFDLAYNLRPTEITGFLGIIQLPYLRDSLQRREANYILLEQSIDSLHNFIKVKHDHINFLPAFAIPFIVSDKTLLEKYIQSLDKAQIETRPLIAGDIQSQPFYKKYVNNKYLCEDTQRIHKQGFYIGNNSDMCSEDIWYIIKKVNNI